MSPLELERDRYKLKAEQYKTMLDLGWASVMKQVNEASETIARVTQERDRLRAVLQRLHDAVFVNPINADAYHDDWMEARRLLAPEPAP